MNVCAGMSSICAALCHYRKIFCWINTETTAENFLEEYAVMSRKCIFQPRFQPQLCPFKSLKKTYAEIFGMALKFARSID